MKEATLKAYLRKHFGINAKQWKKILALGPPTNGDGTYDESQVGEWLIAQGILEKKDGGDAVCYRPEDAAGHFGVSHTTIRNWQQDVTCPATPGFYPIKAMQEWRNQQPGVGRPGRQISDDERRAHRARADKLEMDLAERRGDLVPLREIVNLIRRSTARHKAILLAFPDRLAKRFADLGQPKENVEHARSQCAEMIDDLCDQIARDLLEQAEEDMADEDREPVQ